MKHNHMNDGSVNPMLSTWTARRKAKAKAKVQQCAVSSRERRTRVLHRIGESTIQWVMESGYTREEAEYMARRAERPMRLDSKH